MAGQEPDKTNELLQAIGLALEQNLNSDDAVQTIREGKTKPKIKGDAKPVKEKPSGNGKKEVEKNDKLKPKKVVNGAVKPVVANTKTSRKTEKELASDRSSKTISNSTSRLTKPIKEGKNNTKPGKKERLLVRKISTDDQDGAKKPPIQEENDKKVANEEILVVPTEPEPKQTIEIAISKNIDTVEPVIINNIPSITPSPREPSPKPQITTTPPKSGRKNSVDELSAIIDEEAERRKQERREKRSARQDKLRRPSMNDDSSPLEHIKEDQKVVVAQHLSPKKQPARETQKETNDDQSPIKSVVEPSVPAPSYLRQKSGDLKNGRPRTSLRPPSVRPASARPGAPRRRDKNVEIVLQPEETLKLGEINITVENFNAELEDDGENLIIMEDPESQMKDVAYKGDDMTSQQGHLVQQILETQKEFASGKDGETHGLGNVRIFFYLRKLQLITICF